MLVSPRAGVVHEAVPVTARGLPGRPGRLRRRGRARLAGASAVVLQLCPMRRRDFLLRTAGLAAGLTLARRGISQPGAPDTLPPPPGAAPSPPDERARRAEHLVTLAVAGDTTLGYNLQTHVDEMLAGGVLREVLWPVYPRGIRDVLDAADLALVNLGSTAQQFIMPLPSGRWNLSPLPPTPTLPLKGTKYEAEFACPIEPHGAHFLQFHST